jgi:hypothetical protein
MAARRKNQPDPLLAAKYALIEKVIDVVKVPVWLLVSWVPLQPIREIFGDLAGKDTNVNILASAAATWGTVATAGWVQSAAKSRGRQKRLEAGRARADSLEGRLLPDPSKE